MSLCWYVHGSKLLHLDVKNIDSRFLNKKFNVVMIATVLLLTTLLSLDRCEEILAMFQDRSSEKYDSSTSIFTESKVLKASKVEGQDDNTPVPIPFLRSVFDDVIQLLGDKSEQMDDVGPEDLMYLLCAEGFLDISESRKQAFYKALAQRSLGGRHLSDILDASSRKCKAGDQDISFPPPHTYLSLLRGYAGLRGVDVRVIDGTATLCIWDENEEVYGSTENVSLVRKMHVLSSAPDKFPDTEVDDVWNILSCVINLMCVSGLSVYVCNGNLVSTRSHIVLLKYV